MNRSTLNDEDLKAMRIILAIAVAFGSLVGAVVGAVLILLFKEFSFGHNDSLYFLGAGGGAIVGGVIAFVKTRIQLHRQHEIHLAGAELGLEPPTNDSEADENGIDDEEIKEIENCIREMMPSDGLCTVRVQLCKQLEFATFVVAEVSLSLDRGSDHSKFRRCTVAFFDTKTNRWPAFSMTPEGTTLEESGTDIEIGGSSSSNYRSYRSTKVFDLVFGDHDIDFVENQVFSDSYHLLGIDEPAIRRVFTATTLDYFAEHHGLCVTARDNQLMVYYPFVRCEPPQLKSLVKESLHICQLFSNIEDPSSEEYATDMRAAVDNMPGLLGHVYRQTLVTNDEVEQFLVQHTPRNVPANIKRQFYGVGNLILIVFGLTWTAAGSVFIAMATAFGSDLGVGGTIAKVGASIFVLVGATISWINLRSRWYHRRVLRNGEVKQGIITKAKATGTVVNNRAQYRLDVSLNGDVKTYSIVYGPAGRLAKQVAKNREITRFLADPSGRSEKMIWVESLVQGISNIR